METSFAYAPCNTQYNVFLPTSRKPWQHMLRSVVAVAKKDVRGNVDQDFDTVPSTGEGTIGNSARGSGTTARGRRLLKVREEKRKRDQERLHDYPAWAKVLEDACRNDSELRAVLGDSIGNPELMRKRAEEEFESFIGLLKRNSLNRAIEFAPYSPGLTVELNMLVQWFISFFSTSDGLKKGLEQGGGISQNLNLDLSLHSNFNPLDSHIWFELYGSPSDRDVDLLGNVIQSWYVMGRLGAYNTANLQLANSSMEYDPLYDEEKGFKVMPSSFHDISDVEFQDNWGRVWVDLGTADIFSIDVLLDCLTVLSSEYLGIQQVVFGGRRMGDWEEGMTSPEFGYKSFKI